MITKPLSKEEEHRLHCLKYKKTPEERDLLKKMKSDWKKLNPGRR